MRSDVFNVCCLVRVPGVCSQPSPEARLSASLTAGSGGEGVGGGGGGAVLHTRTPGLPLGCCICAPFFVATAGGASFNL